MYTNNNSTTKNQIIREADEHLTHQNSLINTTASNPVVNPIENIETNSLLITTESANIAPSSTMFSSSISEHNVSIIENFFTKNLDDRLEQLNISGDTPYKFMDPHRYGILLDLMEYGFYPLTDDKIKFIISDRAVNHYSYYDTPEESYDTVEANPSVISTESVNIAPTSKYREPRSNIQEDNALTSEYWGSRSNKQEGNAPTSEYREPRSNIQEDNATTSEYIESSSPILEHNIFTEILDVRLEQLNIGGALNYKLRDPNRYRILLNLMEHGFYPLTDAKIRFIIRDRVAIDYRYYDIPEKSYDTVEANPSSISTESANIAPSSEFSTNTSVGSPSLNMQDNAPISEYRDSSSPISRKQAVIDEGISALQKPHFEFREPWYIEPGPISHFEIPRPPSLITTLSWESKPIDSEERARLEEELQIGIKKLIPVVTQMQEIPPAEMIPAAKAVMKKFSFYCDQGHVHVQKLSKLEVHVERVGELCSKIDNYERTLIHKNINYDSNAFSEFLRSLLETASLTLKKAEDLRNELQNNDSPTLSIDSVNVGNIVYEPINENVSRDVSVQQILCVNNDIDSSSESSDSETVDAFLKAILKIYTEIEQIRVDIMPLLDRRYNLTYKERRLLEEAQDALKDLDDVMNFTIVEFTKFLDEKYVQFSAFNEKIKFKLSLQNDLDEHIRLELKQITEDIDMLLSENSKSVYSHHTADPNLYEYYILERITDLLNYLSSWF